MTHHRLFQAATPSAAQAQMMKIADNTTANQPTA